MQLGMIKLGNDGWCAMDDVPDEYKINGTPILAVFDDHMLHRKGVFHYAVIYWCVNSPEHDGEAKWLNSFGGGMPHWKPIGWKNIGARPTILKYSWMNSYEDDVPKHVEDSTHIVSPHEDWKSTLTKDQLAAVEEAELEDERAELRRIYNPNSSLLNTEDQITQTIYDRLLKNRATEEAEYREAHRELKKELDDAWSENFEASRRDKIVEGISKVKTTEKEDDPRSVFEMLKAKCTMPNQAHVKVPSKSKPK